MEALKNSLKSSKNKTKVREQRLINSGKKNLENELFEKLNKRIEMGYPKQQRYAVGCY